jgi:hypothetical protein
MAVETFPFGSVATTIVFAVVISVAILTLLLLTFFSSKYTFRSMVGVYDPITRAGGRYSYMVDGDIQTRIIQPYVTYNNRTYFMFGNQNNESHRNKVKKLEVLTNKQLNELFPMKTYKEWMNGGKEEIIQNASKGKVGYKENFEIMKQHNNDANINNDIDSDDNNDNNGNNTNNNNTNNNIPTDNILKRSLDYLRGTESNQITLPSDDSQLIEQDITDILQPKKIEYTITETSVPSNNLRIETEKHFTSGICAICLDDLQDDDNVRGLLCGHVFHDLCIDPWLTRRKGCCPTCKKDLYMEVNHLDSLSENVNNNEHNNVDLHSTLSFNINDVINLPVGQPGNGELDDLFNLDPNNLFSFFLILILTKLKAQILLTALQYVRNNNYSLDNYQDNNTDNENNELPDDTISLDLSHDFSTAEYYSEKFAEKFSQPNLSDSLDSPPLPDLTQLNPQIKRVIEHYPRPFQPSDLIDLDQAAWKEIKKTKHCLGNLFYAIIGITKLQLYYYNVVKIYNKRRLHRLNS